MHPEYISIVELRGLLVDRYFAKLNHFHEIYKASKIDTSHGKRRKGLLVMIVAFQILQSPESAKTLNGFSS